MSEVIMNNELIQNGRKRREGLLPIKYRCAFIKIELKRIYIMCISLLVINVYEFL